MDRITTSFSHVRALGLGICQRLERSKFWPLFGSPPISFTPRHRLTLKVRGQENLNHTFFCPLAHPRIFSKVPRAVGQSVLESLRSLTGERFEMCTVAFSLSGSLRSLHVHVQVPDFAFPRILLRVSHAWKSVRGQCVGWRLSPISFSLILGILTRFPSPDL